jgi:hypothetical protein
MCECAACQLARVPKSAEDRVIQLNERRASDYHQDEVFARIKPLEKLASARGLKLLGEGAFRKTYLSSSGKFVYKIPTSEDGFRCNEREHQLYRKKNKDNYGRLTHAQIARCRLSKSGILVMELVKPSKTCYKGYKAESVDLEPPPWAGLIDSSQVGLNRDGNWVAFDYGNE